MNNTRSILLAVFLGLGSPGLVHAAKTATNTTPAPDENSGASITAVTNITIDAAPPASSKLDPSESKPGITITTDSNDDDDESAPGGKKHSAVITFDSKHDSNGSFMDNLGEVIIPLAGIAASFGTPILIVFFICYFKYKRRRESLALVREYLAKGIAVPPQLLDDSQRDVVAATSDPITQGSLDLRKGFKLTFVGLAVSLALYVNWPHSTTWGWGLIPMVIGIGFLVSGALQQRHERSTSANSTKPPPSNKPPR